MLITASQGRAASVDVVCLLLSPSGILPLASQVMTEFHRGMMGKRGPKPKVNPLSVRVQFRISADTMAAYEDLADVLELPVYHLMRQALDESAGTMITMAAAFRQMKGDDPVKGLQLYRQMLDSFAPQLEVQQGVSDVWLDEVRERVAAKAAATDEKGGTV